MEYCRQNSKNKEPSSKNVPSNNKSHYRSVQLEQRLHPEANLSPCLFLLHNLYQFSISLKRKFKLPTIGLSWWLSGNNLLPMHETRVQSLGQEDALEKKMATHSSILVWEIPWKEKPGRLQSTGYQKRWILLGVQQQHCSWSSSGFMSLCTHLFLPGPPFPPVFVATLPVFRVRLTQPYNFEHTAFS